MNQSTFLSRFRFIRTRPTLCFLAGIVVGAGVTAIAFQRDHPEISDVAIESNTNGNTNQDTVADQALSAKAVQPDTEARSRKVPGAAAATPENITSPNHALEFGDATLLEDHDQRRARLREVLANWVTLDHKAAFAAIENLDNVALRRDLTQLSLTTLADEAPGTAIALLPSMPSEQHDQLWERAFLNWAKTDPEAAVTAWETRQHSVERREGLKGLANSFARKDVAAAIEWASSLEKTEEQRRAMHQIVGGTINRDPALAAEQIGALTEIDREAALSYVEQIAERWGEQDRSAAIEWAETLTPEQRDSALREIAHRQIHQDPETAQALANTIERDDLRLGVISELGKLWMTAGADEAAHRINELPREEQQAAWRGAASEWARSNPEDAAAFALSGDLDESVQQQLIQSAVPQWSRIDPVEAAEFALQLPEASRQEALKQVVQEWSGSDPVATIGFLIDSVEGPHLQEMTRQAVKHWSHIDPAEAATYVTDLEQGAFKDTIARDVTQTWMQRDSIGASEWIASLEPSPTRDNAVEVLIHHIEREEPDAAALWAETISDPQKRDEALNRLEGQ